MAVRTILITFAFHQEALQVVKELLLVSDVLLSALEVILVAPFVFQQRSAARTASDQLRYAHPGMVLVSLDLAKRVLVAR